MDAVHIHVCVKTHLLVLTVTLWPWDCILFHSSSSLLLPLSLLFSCPTGYKSVLQEDGDGLRRRSLFFLDLSFPSTWSSRLPYILFTHHPLTPSNYCSIIRSQGYTGRTLLPWKHMIPIIKSPCLYWLIKSEKGLLLHENLPNLLKAFIYKLFT